jgi:hypothetical protein
VRVGSRKPLVIVGVLGLVLSVASYAWACSPGADLSATGSGTTSSGTPSGPSGSRATVKGSGFASGPVEIRWNSVSGPELARPSGPSFTIAVTVPETSPRTYYFVALQRDRAGSMTGSTRAAFEVTEAGAAEGQPGNQPSSGSEPGGSGETSGSANGGGAQAGGSGQNSGSASGGGSQGSGSGQTSGSASGSEGSASGGSGQTSGSASGGGAAGGNGQTSGSASGAGGSGGGSPSTPGGQTSGSTVGSSFPAFGFNGSNNPAVVTTPTGQRVFGGSVAPGETGGRATPAGAPAAAGAPSERTTSGDIYSAFGPAANSSLVPGLVPSGTPGGSNSNLMLTVTLLSAGAFMLFSAVVVAAMRRRRVLAAKRR